MRASNDRSCSPSRCQALKESGSPSLLAEDRLAHYPEFRDFFVRMFDLDRKGLERARICPRAVRTSLTRSFSSAEAAPPFHQVSKSMPSWMHSSRSMDAVHGSRSLVDSALDDRRRRCSLDGRGFRPDRTSVPCTGGSTRLMLSPPSANCQGSRHGSWRVAPPAEARLD